MALTAMSLPASARARRGGLSCRAARLPLQNLVLLFFLLAAALPCAGAALDAAISQLLQQRIGLTRREADLVQHRHRKQTGALLQIAELEATIEALPPALLPGHVAHLLRAHPLSSLQGLDPQRHRWCSYKTALCDCAALPPPSKPAVVVCPDASPQVEAGRVSDEVLGVAEQRGGMQRHFVLPRLHIA